ncbi:LLM class flavin-dependent oxidoreductase [Halomonas sp. B23F22_10]|uniref:LLM class flavin-dependent oxidoreductase n=1 Tax=Halomonas sp. B23F22_10 TaxID=3459515 RepID=UPI00373F5A8D
MNLGLVVPLESYPALNHAFSEHGDSFRESVAYIQRLWEDSPAFDNRHGRIEGTMDMLPKPASGRLPLIVTGGSQQSPEWIAGHGDGWMRYPRALETQARNLDDWRARTRALGRGVRPAMQPLYIDLSPDPDAAPEPIHLGRRVGVRALRHYLETLEAIGVNHVALNLRFNRADIDDTLYRLADDILPAFSPQGETRP